MPLRFRIRSLPPASPTLDGGVAPVGTSSPGSSQSGTEERLFELTADPPEVRLGRQPTFELELPFPAVSAFHARLFRGESVHEWWLEDQGSTNGTWLDGQRLAPRRPVLIRGGQRMRVGSVEILFEGWAPTVRGGQSTATIARRLISDLFGAVGNDAPALTLEAGRAAPAVLRLTERERRYVAGRDEACDLVIAGDQASREHAAFERRWEGVFVSDLGSRNGVLVDGAAITAPHRLRDGETVQLGGVTLRLTDPEDRYLQQLEALDDAGGDGKANQPAAPAAPVAARPAEASVRSGLSRTTSRDELPPSSLPAASRPAARPAMSAGRKLAMALAAAVLIAAVAGLILLLAG